MAIEIPTECSNSDCQSRLHLINDEKNDWMERYLAQARAKKRNRTDSEEVVLDMRTNRTDM